MGESGTGKSTSMERLDPKTTFVIKAKEKPLPFRGSNKKYKKCDADNPTGNLLVSHEHGKIIAFMDKINASRPEITTIVIDDFQYLMVDEFMSKINEKGWDKFNVMADHVWKVLNKIGSYRDDLDVIVMTHNQILDDGTSTCKLIGNMIREKVGVEGMFTIVLHTMVTDGQYKFLTQYHSGPKNTFLSKSPKGMFEDKLIDNDLQMVKEKIKEYFDEEFEDDVEQ
jgi:hypothetical protein